MRNEKNPRPADTQGFEVRDGEISLNSIWKRNVCFPLIVTEKKT